MKIFIGCDLSGVDYKNSIIELLRLGNHEVVDVGLRAEEDYPMVAKEVSLEVIKNLGSRGILICGTGMGMCLAANKFRGIRATLCRDVYSAMKSRTSNDANILTLGALTMGIEEVKSVVSTWTTDYELNQNSKKKLEEIASFEKINFRDE